MNRSIFGLVSTTVFGILLIGNSNLAADDNQQLNKLEAVARTFGYVRYFHPSDQASLVDWDSMAYYVVKQTKDSKSSESIQQLLNRLFGSLVVDLEIYEGQQKPRPETFSTTADEIVAWQHKGVGLDQPGIYQSVRLNREMKIKQRAAGPFGNVLTSIDAKELRGKQIRYRFAAKVLEGKSRLQGWYRIDRESGGIGLFDNMNDRPVTDRQWSEYELTGTVDDDADRLTLGVMFFGDGSALVDHIRLEKMENEDWQPIGLENADFESNTKEADGWSQPVQGYFLEIEQDDVSHGKQAVRIGRRGSTRMGKPLFDSWPEKNEVVDVEIAPGLRLRMPLSLSIDHRYAAGDDPQTDRFIESVNSTLTDNAPQSVASIANVILLWNVFQHFYPYFDQVETDWDASLTTALKMGDQASDDRQAATKNLQWLVAQLHDGHGNVYDVKSSRLFSAVLFKWIEDQLVVVASEDPGFQVGDIVVQVADRDAKQHLEEIEQAISGSPQWKRYRSCQMMSQGKEKLVLKIDRAGRELTVDLAFLRRQPLEIDKGDEVRVVVDADSDEEDIWYIDMGRATPKEVNAELKDLAKAKGIVLDFRGYPRGTQFLFQHMTDKHMQSQQWLVPEQIHPDRVNMQNWTPLGRWQMPPRKPRFQGKMVFITDASAISYAESCMAIVANYELGPIIGSPTAGANGNVNPFGLPGGYRVAWTGMRVINHDDSQHHVFGVQPTIPMEPTLNGIKSGQDELLEAAIRWVQADD